MSTSPKLNIVCALKTHGGIPTTVPAEVAKNLEAVSEHTPEAQRGIWNKGNVNFFVKGEPDELFEQSEVFQ